LLSPAQKILVSKVTRILTDYKNSEDMIRIGAYVRGSHADTDYAIDMIDKVNTFLQQPVIENCSIEGSLRALEELLQ
jgi:flagellum-specific ATP synthase